MHSLRRARQANVSSPLIGILAISMGVLGLGYLMLAFQKATKARASLPKEPAVQTAPSLAGSHPTSPLSSPASPLPSPSTTSVLPSDVWRELFHDLDLATIHARGERVEETLGKRLDRLVLRIQADTQDPIAVAQQTLPIAEVLTNLQFHEAAYPLFEKSYRTLTTAPPEHQSRALEALAGWGWTAIQRYDLRNGIERLTLAHQQQADQLGKLSPATNRSLEYLALAYLQDRRLEEALPRLEQVVAFHRQKVGEQDSHTRTLICRLVDAYCLAGNFDAALVLAEDAYQECLQTLGENDLESLRIRHQMAKLQVAMGQYAQAIEAMEAIYSQRKNQLGVYHPQSFLTLIDVASLYRKASNPAKAASVFERLGLQWNSMHEQRPASRLEIASLLAEAWLEQGEVQSALTLMEATVRQTVDLFGAEHPLTARRLGTLAQIHIRRGEAELAVQEAEQALQILSVHVDGAHPDGLDLRDILADAMAANKQPTKGREVAKETWKRSIERLGPNHPQTLQRANRVAEGFVVERKYSDAITLYEQSLTTLRERIGLEHPLTLACMNNLGRAYRLANEPLRAKELFSQALDGLITVRGPKHSHTVLTRFNLALALEDLGEHEESAKQMEEVLERRKIDLGIDHPDTIATMNWLREAYERQQNWPKAIEVAELYATAMDLQYSVDHFEFHAAQAKLSRLYATNHQPLEAARAAEWAYEGFRKSLGEEEERTREAQAFLGRCYQVAGQYREAIPFLEPALALRDLPSGIEAVRHALRQCYAHVGNREAHQRLAQSMRLEAQTTWPEPTPELAEFYSTLGEEYLLLDDVSAAEESLRMALSLYQRLQLDSWLKYQTESRLGQCLLQQQQWDPALEALESGYRGLQNQFLSIPKFERRVVLEQALGRLKAFAEQHHRLELVRQWEAEWSQLPFDSAP